MDRASDSGSEGWGFESLPVYQKSRYPLGYLLFCALRAGRDSNNLNAARTSAAGEGWTEPNLD